MSSGRKEVQDLIAQKFTEIIRIVKQHCPEDDYFTISMVDGDTIQFNNAYWEHEDDGVLKGYYKVDFKQEKGGEKHDESIGEND